MLKWLGLSAVVIALDLYTKYRVQAALIYGEHVTVTSFFDLVLFLNPGAAFSFLSSENGWQGVFFGLCAVIASVFIVWMLLKHPDKKLFCFALSLILGGAIGNLWDRITLGHVVDFLYFHYNEHDWPAFNVADSAIFCGVVLLIWDEFKKPATGVS